MLQRQVLGGFAVMLASILSVAAARGIQKTTREDAPPYRQKGAPDAKVVIVEYSDFQCPACRVAEEPLKSLLALYGKDARFVFKHFPLERVHPHARAAALAAECAGRQGQFWQLHDKLYGSQSEWVEAKSPEDQLRTYAGKLKLDEKAFAACLADPRTAADVNSDIKEAQNRWVGSTPTFFINRKRFVGGRQLSSRGPSWIDKLIKK